MRLYRSPPNSDPPPSAYSDECRHHAHKICEGGEQATKGPAFWTEGFLIDRTYTQPVHTWWQCPSRAASCSSFSR